MEQRPTLIKSEKLDEYRIKSDFTELALRVLRATDFKFYMMTNKTNISNILFKMRIRCI